MNARWLDALHRGLLDSGEISRCVEERAINGVIFNLKSFEKAVSAGTEYDPLITELLAREDLDASQLFEALTIADAREVADLLRPIYERSKGVFGYVSIGISPRVAQDSQSALETVSRTWERIDRSNVLIQVPGTVEGLLIIPDLVERGIGFHLTDLFSLDAYRNESRAYVDAVERKYHRGKAPKEPIGCLAGFRMKALNLLVDTLLGDRIRSSTDEEEIEELKGKLGRAGLAASVLAYSDYRSVYSSVRWKKLEAKGASPQRILWDSGEDVRSLDAAQADAYWKDLATLGLSSEALAENLLRNELGIAIDCYDRIAEALERKRREKLVAQLDSVTYSIPPEISWMIEERMSRWEMLDPVPFKLESERIQEYAQLGRNLVQGGADNIVFFGNGAVTRVARAMGARVYVVNSCDPAEIKSIESEIDWNRVRFVVSNHDPETRVLTEYFRNRAPHVHPLTVIETGALSGFYLSCFVAAMMDLDLDAYLERSMKMAHSCAPGVPPQENPGIHLGVLLNVLSRHGRDKLSVVCDRHLGPFVEWLDLLLANESLLPFVAEDLRVAECYGPDRIFMLFKEEEQEEQERLLVSLRDSGQPVIRIQIRDRLNLGQEFLRFGVAASVLSFFEEVELAKPHRLEALDLDPSVDLTDTLEEFFTGLNTGEYFAILSYLPRHPEIEGKLDAIRETVHRKQRMASILSYNVESHLRDSMKGAILQVTAEDRLDLAIPGRWNSFGRFKESKIFSDAAKLEGRARRVLTVKVRGELLAALDHLRLQIKSALSEVEPLNNQLNTEGINREWRRDSRKKAR